MLSGKKAVSAIGSFYLFVLLSAGMVTTMYSQDNTWNGKKCAIVFTYDDALNVHLDNVLPILDSLGFNGTFYLAGSFPAMQPRLDDWRAAAEKGNELGSHSLFHPCKGSLPNRDWVKTEYDLDTYTLRQMKDELVTMNSFLTALDGKTKRTYAYPCGETTIGDSSYIPIVEENFTAARGVENILQTIDEVDLYCTGCYPVDDSITSEQLENLVDEAVEKNALLVFLFHGVGGEHSINVSLEVHNELLKYVKENEDKIWVAPLENIAEYIVAERSK